MAGPPIPSGVAGLPPRGWSPPPASPVALPGLSTRLAQPRHRGRAGLPTWPVRLPHRAQSASTRLTAPLTYPGTPPWRPAVLVTDAAVLTLQPRHDAPLGQWLCRRMMLVLPSARFPEICSPRTTPGDLASPDTFTGETQSRGLTPTVETPPRRGRITRRPTARWPATPSRTTQKLTAPSPTVPSRTTRKPTARVRMLRLGIALTILTCRNFLSTATCGMQAAHRWRRLCRCSRSVRTPPQLSCGGSWPTLACPRWCRLPR